MKALLLVLDKTIKIKRYHYARLNHHAKPTLTIQKLTIVRGKNTDSVQTKYQYDAALIHVGINYIIQVKNQTKREN